MIPEPRPTAAIGQAAVATEIYMFPPGSAAISNWEDDSRCEFHLEGDSSPVIHIVANVAGLRSLARHCLTLAQEGQEGAHVDYDAESGWFETPEFGLRVSRAWD